MKRAATASVAAASAVLVVSALGCAGARRVSMPSTMVRPARGEAAPWRAPTPSLLTLPSGLTIAVDSEPGLPLVHVTAIVKAGSALDGEREGLAEATADMLVEGGAGVRSGPELAEALERLGDELQIEADADYVQFHLATPARGLQRALALLSDVLMRPRFDEEAWRRERTRRLAELRAAGDEPATVAERVFHRVLFGRHPYGHDPTGTEAALARIEASDLRAFYAANYGPRTTTLLLVGDLTDEVGPLLAASFESFGGGPQVAPLPPPPPPPLAAPRLVIVDRPGAAQSQLRVGGLGVPRASADFPSAALLGTVLGGSFTSRLVQNLRERRGLTYDVHAVLMARDAPGPLVVRTAVRTDATAVAVGEILAEVRGLREPLPADEIARARAVMIGKLIEGFSTGESASRLLSSMLAHGAAPDDWARLPDELLARDGARLAADAARMVDPARLVVVVVGDRAAIEPSLAALPGLPPIEHASTLGELLPARTAATTPPAPQGPSNAPASSTTPVAH